MGRGPVGTASLALLLGWVASAGCGGDDQTPPSGTPEVESSSSGADPANPSTSGPDGTADDSSTGSLVDPDAPTWHQNIAPLVSERCTGCHTQGGIAPFSFDDFESTAPLAEAIAASVLAGSMPPWGAAVSDECEPSHGFEDDISLSSDQIELFQAWSDAGAPEGDPASAVELPSPPNTELSSVDMTLQIATEVTMDGIKDEFLCFSLDPELAEERYFSGMQIVPGNDKIVHHVLVYSDDDGETAAEIGPDGTFPCSGGGIEGTLLAAWAPGSVPMQTPPDLGMRVPAGARIVLNVHYHPTGLGPETDDSTQIQIDWMDEVPTWRGELALIGNTEDSDELLPNSGDRGDTPEFRIPAGASGHLEEMVVDIPGDIPLLRVWSVGTHMHYVGTDMMVRFQGDDGYDQCMLHTPRYSFEWQRLYRYQGPLEEMPPARGGDRIYLRCSYDNSMNNPYVAEALRDQGLDAPIDVVLGEETLDEMCLGVFGIAVPSAL